MASTEPTYTLAEAQIELERRACADAGHFPSHVIFTDNVPTVAYCACNAKRWSPEDTPKGDKGTVIDANGTVVLASDATDTTAAP